MALKVTLNPLFESVITKRGTMYERTYYPKGWSGRH